MQISIEIVVTVGVAIMSAFFMLVKMIRSADMKRVEDLEKSCAELRKTAAKRHDDAIADLKAVTEDLADIRETIAGFGCQYLPRKEYLDDRNAQKD